jgi:hypothetical protein
MAMAWGDRSSCIGKRLTAFNEVREIARAVLAVDEQR